MSATQSGRIVALVSIAIIVPMALILSGACQLPGLKTTPPTGDELDQLETYLAGADVALGVTRLGCRSFEEPQDRDTCISSLAGIDRALDLGRSIVATAKTCRAAGDEVCRLEQLRQAKEILPEIITLIGQIRAGGAGASQLAAFSSGALDAPPAPVPDPSASMPAAPPSALPPPESP
jgi:hypothetical protein